MPSMWWAVMEPCRRTGRPLALLRGPTACRIPSGPHDLDSTCREALPAHAPLLTWGGSSSLPPWASGTARHWGTRPWPRRLGGEPRGGGGLIWRRDGPRRIWSVRSQVSRLDRRRCITVATTRASSSGATTAWSAAINAYRVVVRRSGVAAPLPRVATVATWPGLHHALHPVSSCRAVAVDAAPHPERGIVLGAGLQYDGPRPHAAVCPSGRLSMQYRLCAGSCLEKAMSVG